MYGAPNKRNLIESLQLAFGIASNVLIECEEITIGVLKAEESYYVADPCWIGPPLFDKDRGALYVLRCKNLNSLTYAIVKIFNTSQRVDFLVTPLTFAFEQRDQCVSENKVKPTARKKVLSKSLRSGPGSGRAPSTPVSGKIIDT